MHRLLIVLGHICFIVIIVTDSLFHSQLRTVELGSPVRQCRGEVPTRLRTLTNTKNNTILCDAFCERTSVDKSEKEKKALQEESSSGERPFTVSRTQLCHETFIGMIACGPVGREEKV